MGFLPTEPKEVEKVSQAPQKNPAKAGKRPPPVLPDVVEESEEEAKPKQMARPKPRAPPLPQGASPSACEHTSQGRVGARAEAEPPRAPAESEEDETSIPFDLDATNSRLVPQLDREVRQQIAPPDVARNEASPPSKEASPYSLTPGKKSKLVVPTVGSLMLEFVLSGSMRENDNALDALLAYFVVRGHFFTWFTPGTGGWFPRVADSS